MTGFRRAAWAAVLFCFGCAGETAPAKGTASAQPPEETVPEATVPVNEPAAAVPTAVPTAVPYAVPYAAPIAAPTPAPPEAAFPPACGDYIGLLISLRQAQKDAGRKVDVPQRQQLELNYRREAAKRDYDKLAELCAVGINMVMNQLGKVPPPAVPPDTQASPRPEP